MGQLPLWGKKILVTRSAQQAGKLSAGLHALGADPVEVPVLEICPPLSFDGLDAALRDLLSYDWLILTSANTVRAITTRAHTLGLSLCQPETLKVAAVGEATAEAARKAGFALALVPESYVAESLVEELVEQAFGQRMLLARAEVARDVIPDALRAVGAEVDVVEAYRNQMPVGAPDALRQALGAGLDAATFTSSSSATHLAAAAKAAGVAFPLQGVPAVSIGPITSQTLAELGWTPAAEAHPHDIPGLVAAVCSLWAAPNEQ